MVDYVTKLHDAQKEKKAWEEEFVVAATEKAEAISLQVEAPANVVDDIIVRKVPIYLIDTGVMDKTLEVSHAAPADEVVPHDKEPLSK